MIRTFAVVLSAASILAGTTTASAGIYADDLSRCLVSSTTDADAAVLIQGIFSALSVNPTLTGMTTTTSGQRDTYNKKMAALYERLLTVDCRKQYIQALKYEGESVVAGSFNVLGNTAVRGLMNQKDVVEQMNKMGSYIDKNKIEELSKEAGITTPSSPASPAAPNKK